jgi:hypothetical protein
MSAITTITTFLAAVLLGLTAGALVAEGAILVPFWRSLSPASFLGWYKQHAAILQKFFGTLEVAAAVVTIFATVLSWVSHDPSARLMIVSALLVVAVLAVFPIYFQQVNTSFAAATIALDRVPAELRRWSSWHWARTLIAVTAFIAAFAATTCVF